MFCYPCGNWLRRGSTAELCLFVRLSTNHISALLIGRRRLIVGVALAQRVGMTVRGNVCASSNLPLILFAAGVCKRTGRHLRQWSTTSYPLLTVQTCAWSGPTCAQAANRVMTRTPLVKRQLATKAYMRGTGDLTHRWERGCKSSNRFEIDPCPGETRNSANLERGCQFLGRGLPHHGPRGDCQGERSNSGRSAARFIQLPPYVFGVLELSRRATPQSPSARR